MTEAEVECYFDDSMARPEIIRLKSGPRHHEPNIEHLLRELHL